jgi:hypothetical protein
MTTTFNKFTNFSQQEKSVEILRFVSVRVATFLLFQNTLTNFRFKRIQTNIGLMALFQRRNLCKIKISTI